MQQSAMPLRRTRPVQWRPRPDRSRRSLSGEVSLAKTDFELVRDKLLARHVDVRGQRYYVAERDLLLDDAQVTEYLRLFMNTQQLGEAPPEHSFVDRGRRLLARTRGGRVVRWKDGMPLSYGIARETFADREYRTLRANMHHATRSWEEVCGIRFAYLEASNHGTADEAESDAMFTVLGEDTGGEVIASAFFPDDPPNRRFVVIDPSYFAAALEFDPVGVLRHEIGHVLGFRHEHIRTGGWVECDPEDLRNTLGLTQYDSKSVMHYLCDGIGSAALELTEVDREGAQKVYGPPFGLFELVT